MDLKIIWEDIIQKNIKEFLLANSLGDINIYGMILSSLLEHIVLLRLTN